MGPGERDNRHGSDYPLAGDGLDRLLADLRGPLTVIQLSAQLLHRRIHQGEASDTQQLLDRLAAIERASQRLETRLQRLEQDVRGR